MKALSYIVASILMLIITVALSGTAYMFMSGVFTAGIQGIEIADAYCSLGEVTLKIKNIGTAAITGLEIEQISPLYDVLVPTAPSIEPGQTVALTDVCSGESPRQCKYRITPPTGKTITSDISCSNKPGSLVLAIGTEPSGRIIKDRSGKGNDGVFHGSNINDGTLMPDYAAGDAPKRVNGKYGKALEFDGENDNVEVLHSDSLEPDYISILAWIKPLDFAQVENEGVIVRKFSWTNKQGYRFLFGNDEMVFLSIGNGTAWMYAWSPDGSVPLNRWTHVAGTYNGSHMSIYVDGTLASPPVSQTNPIAPSGKNLGIGAESVTYKRFNGIIDEVRIFNWTLTEKEIQAEMQTSVPIADPVAAWSFEESGQYANDTHFFVNGKFDNSLSFDGIDERVVIGDKDSLEPQTFTLEAWIKHFGPPDEVIHTKSTYNAFEGYELYIITGNKLKLWIGDGTTTFTLISDTTLDTDTWYHVAGIYDGTYMKLYINGVLDKEINIGSQTIYYDTTLFVIGSHYTGRYFNGTIDEVRIYNKALI